MGDFDTRVELLKPKVVRTETGSVERTWTAAGHVYARVETRKATEEAGNEVRLTETLEATTHDVAGIDHTWRAMVGEDLYEILATERMERRWLRMTLWLLPGGINDER